MSVLLLGMCSSEMIPCVFFNTIPALAQENDLRWGGRPDGGSVCIYTGELTEKHGGPPQTTSRPLRLNPDYF
mgnify:CR=1 FL=1